MDREKAISTIECLFPADSEYADTAAIGQELLDEAKRRVSNWRNEPDEVLSVYAHLCIRKEKC